MSRDLAEQADGLLLSQYAGSPNLHATVKATVGILQELDDDAERLAKFADISSATGEWLDRIGAIRNISRNSGESDTSYAARIRKAAGRNDAGTPDAIIRAAAELSGDEAPVLFDEAPAVVFVYTPNGHQLPRATTKRMAPTGVLCVPGARIKLVSHDATLVNGEGVEYGIVDADGNVIVGADGDTMAGPMRGARTLLCVASDNNIVGD